MKISALMIPDPITITGNPAISDAIELMKSHAIRHLPVVSKNNFLTGLVTLADLKRGIIPSMVGDLTLQDLIIKDPIVVAPEDDVEIAAQLIYQHKISGMPVVSKRKLVGIITETDILRAFIDMMGILKASSRIDVEVDDKPGVFNGLMRVITQNGGDIISTGMTTPKPHQRVYYFRLAACETGAIEEALVEAGYKVLATTN